MRQVSEWLVYLGQNQILKKGPMQNKRLFSFLYTLDLSQSNFLQFSLYPHNKQPILKIDLTGVGEGWSGSSGLADANYYI